VQKAEMSTYRLCFLTVYMKEIWNMCGFRITHLIFYLM